MEDTDGAVVPHNASYRITRYAQAPPLAGPQSTRKDCAGPYFVALPAN